MKRRSAARGMTLIEIMIAAGIFTVAMLVAFTLVNQAGELIRNDQEISDSNDNSRLALEYLSGLISTAGVGAPGGIFVRSPPSFLINPVYADDNIGATGSDGIWVVTPAPKAFGQYCADPGAGAALTASTATNLTVASALTPNCTNSFVGFSNLLVSNMQTAALVTVLSLTPPTGIHFSEAGLTDSPIGYKPGDLVYGAAIYHFTIAPNVANAGKPALYRTAGALNGAANPSAPFINDPAATPQVIYDNIEDLQIAFIVDASGQGDPQQYQLWEPQAFGVPVAGRWGPLYTAGLRGVRLSVVAKSTKLLHDTSGKTQTSAAVTNLAPMTIENNAPALPPDGYRRSVYSRRIELPNMNTVTL